MPRVQLKKSLALFMAFIVVISSIGANNIILFAGEDLYDDEQIASNLKYTSHATTTPPAIILPPSIPEVDTENDLTDDYNRVTEGETLYFDGLYITIGGFETGITAFDSNVSNSTGDFIAFSPAEHYIYFPDIEHGSNVQHSHTINIDKIFGHHTTNVHFSVINVHGVRSPSFFLHTFMEHQPSQTLTFSTALGLPVGSYQTTIEFRIVPLLHPTVTEEIHAVTLLFNVVPVANASYCCANCSCWADCNLVDCQCDFIPVTNATWHNQLGRPFFQGETLQLEYTIIPSNATIQDVTWFSLDPTIAHVSDTGLLTIGRPGVTTIGLTTGDRGFTITRVIVSRIRDDDGVFVSVAADPLFHWGYRFWFQERGMRQHTFNIPYHLIGFPNKTVVQGDSSLIEFQVRNVSNERQDDVSLVFTGDISNVLEIIYPVGDFWLGSANFTQTNPTPLGAIRHAAFNLRADAPYGTFSGYLEFFQNGQLISTGGSSGLGMPLTWTVLPAGTPAYNVTVSTVIGGTATATPTTATLGTSISLTATPSYNFIEWQTTPAVSWTGGTTATNPNATFDMPSSDVTVTPVFNPTNYSIDLFQISGGTATVSHANAPAGTSITLTATPTATHTFERWEISPYVTFTTGYANSQTATFTMPSGNVIIIPTFTAIGSPTWSTNPVFSLGLDTNSNPTVVGFGGLRWLTIGYDGVGVASYADTLTLYYEYNRPVPIRIGTQFNSVSTLSTSSDYYQSALYVAMGDMFGQLPNREQNLVRGRFLQGGTQPEDMFDPGFPGHNPDHIAGPNVYNAGFWPLSRYEANMVNIIVRSDPLMHIVQPIGITWLRSPSDPRGWIGGEWVFQGARAWQINQGGGIQANFVTQDRGVRPAFNLNMLPLVFTAAVDSKPTNVGGNLTAIQPITGVISFTMQHPEQTLYINATAEQATQSGTTLYFNYSNATVGANQFISTILLNSDDEVRYYGKLVQVSSNAQANGTLSIPIAGITNGTYTIKIFSEQINDTYYTDFASQPIIMTVVVDNGIGTVGNLKIITVPYAPANVQATAGNGQATVTFNVPVYDGSSPITSYTVTSNPGGITASGTASPITVTGLTNGVTYTFTVVATNAEGDSLTSQPSNAVIPLNAVTFNNANANGTNNTTTTTQLTLNFDNNPLGLSISNISLPSGINALSLQGTGNSRTVNISGNWVNGQQITVTLTNPTGYNINPLSQTVTLYRSPAPNPCICTNNACGSSNACAADNCTCTVLNLPNLCTCVNNACGGNNACATDNCACTRAGGNNDGNSGNGGNDTGSGNDNGGGWQPSITPPSRPQITIHGNNGGAYTHGRVSNNQVTLSLNGSNINNFINTAIDNTITFYMYELANITTVVVPRTAVRQFANSGLALEIHMPDGVISFNPTALKDLGQQARNANISIRMEEIQKSDLTEIQQEALTGEYSIFLIKVFSGNQRITDFEGIISVTVPFATTSNPSAWHLTDNGIRVGLDSRFDPTSQTITFGTNSLSIFIVGNSPAIPLPNVWIEPSNALIAELRETMSDYFIDVWDYMDIIVTLHHANDIGGGLVVADVHFTVGDAELDSKLRGFNAPFTLFADLTGFIPIDMNYHRITAVSDGITVGGGINAHVFAVDINSTGAISITYVENLRRLIISPDSHVIIDLAGNALTQKMDVRPIVENGRTLIPIRFIAEALGAEVDWIPATNDSPPGVTLLFEGRTLTFAIGEIISGMDVPVQIINGRTMVPLRFVIEFFGAVVTTDTTGIIEIVSDISKAGRQKSMEQNGILYFKKDEISSETPEPIEDDNESDTPESYLLPR